MMVCVCVCVCFAKLYKSVENASQLSGRDEMQIVTVMHSATELIGAIDLINDKFDCCRENASRSVFIVENSYP